MCLYSQSLLSRKRKCSSSILMYQEPVPTCIYISVIILSTLLTIYILGQESAGESFYMLFRAIKHQVDKGPVDVVTGKAKYTLNDNRLLREDVEYRTLVRMHKCKPKD